MTLERAKALKPGTVLYELDSCFGPHRRVVTAEDGHTWNEDDPFISLSHLIKRFDGMGGTDYYPCYCFFESYDECKSHEISPYDYV